MIKNNPRIRVSYFNLKIKDITNLDFTKLVYIDGVYWRINKVIDYMPHKNQTTKVELIEWTELGTNAATNPDLGSGDGGWEIYAGEGMDENNQGF